jgi:hypothetical protein
VCGWYVAYPISYRQLEEMMEERGVGVDHSTPNRWVERRAVDASNVESGIWVKKRRVAHKCVFTGEERVDISDAGVVKEVPYLIGHTRGCPGHHGKAASTVRRRAGAVREGGIRGACEIENRLPKSTMKLLNFCVAGS